MNVVVYLRQAGGTAAKDYPLQTRWVEDENEVPLALFSTFILEGLDGVPQEVADQIKIINPWLEEKRGVVVATFTEVEHGSPHRPAYGAARKAAAFHRAALVVATTKAIAGQVFAPSDSDSIRVIALQDPEVVAREKWASSRDVVIYLRTGNGLNSADILLEKQRRELAKMTGYVNILAEFQEMEGPGSTNRPELAKAIALCRERQARLFIGTTDGINGEPEFWPDFTDVPYEVAYRKAYEWPELISIAPCPYPVALLFGTQFVRGNIPVYIANNTAIDFTGIEVRSKGAAVFANEAVETTIGSKDLGPVPSGQARLVEAYDVYFDGDFLIEYRVTAKLPDGTMFSGRALLKDIPHSRWLRVDSI